MFNKALLMAYAKEVDDSRNTLRFVAGKDGSGINFFTDVDQTIHSPELYTVFVNGEETEQVFTSLTFAKDDEVKIVCSGENGFPRFLAEGKDYISSVSVLPYMTDELGEPICSLDNMMRVVSCLTSIPQGLFDNNDEVTSFNSTFYSCIYLTSIPQGLFDDNTKVTNFSNTFSMCSCLTSIPQGLFDNNDEVTSFYNTFYGCGDLTSIPQGLFDNNPKVTSFGGTFSACSDLTSIPQGLFDNNDEVTSFYRTFYRCSKLTGSVKIGSTKVTDCTDFCKGTGAMTVIVPAGSTTESTFRAYAETVTNLTVETFEP